MAATVAVIGATASGKSTVAMEVARKAPGVELVSIDAMQVYRGMDIGTAKPSPAEQAEVRHHLIDLVEPAEEFTVARFQAEYRQAVAGVHQRGGTPLLVGGTGLYLRAVIDDLDLPKQYPAVRAELDELTTEDLYLRLQELDPQAATKMEPTNRRRVLRATEVCVGSGRPFSSYGPGIDAYPPSDVTQVALRWPRAELAARIEARVLAMMGGGLLEEVRGLLRSDQPELSRTARQALGYKELIDHLEGHCTLAEAAERIVLRTRQFAVRQDRWFRRDPRVRWLDITSSPLEAVPMVLEAMGR